MQRKDQHDLNYFRQLAHKLMGGTISDEEMKELEAWYNRDEGNPVYISRSFVTDESVQEQRLLNKIKEQIGKEAQKKTKVKRLWIRSGWAAAILSVVLTSAYFLLNNQGSEGDLADADKHEVLQPGGNKALLTLADGSTVVLDVADNGEISMQGDVSVVKLDDGQLSYSGKNGSGKVLYNTIETPAGGQYQITLSDGTTVWLNAKSSLHFPTAFNGQERRVELTGEGYFEVAHNAEQPFYVGVGDMHIKVLGTHFNVNAYSDERDIKTTLTEGSVVISDHKASAKLIPGQQAQWSPTNQDIRVIRDVNLDEVLAWKNGYFYFAGASIQTILQDAARWYDAKIVYEGDVRETFTGNLPRSENINKLLKVLESTGKVEFQIVGKQIIVKPK